MLIRGTLLACAALLFASNLNGQVRATPLGVKYTVVNQGFSENTRTAISIAVADATTPVHQRHLIRGMLIGGAIGAVIGEGVAAYQVSRASSRNELSGYSYVAGPIVGGIIGAIIGALAGT